MKATVTISLEDFKRLEALEKIAKETKVCRIIFSSTSFMAGYTTEKYYSEADAIIKLAKTNNELSTSNNKLKCLLTENKIDYGPI